MNLFDLFVENTRKIPDDEVSRNLRIEKLKYETLIEQNSIELSIEKLNYETLKTDLESKEPLYDDLIPFLKYTIEKLSSESDLNISKGKVEHLTREQSEYNKILKFIHLYTQDFLYRKTKKNLWSELNESKT